MEFSFNFYLLLFSLSGAVTNNLSCGPNEIIYNNECKVSRCLQDIPCQHGGICSMGSSPDQYTCDCTGTGYQGMNCEEDVNECETGDHNCTFDATCINIEGSFKCEFQGEVIKDRLRRIVAPQPCGGTCHSNASCQSNTCVCNSGFTGNGTFCEDIDECNTGSHNCHQNATCMNNVGSFTCQCNTGFIGNGTSCDDIDECNNGSHNCHQNATCMNNIGSFTCQCNTGFIGNGTSCDVDCYDNCKRNLLALACHDLEKRGETLPMPSKT